MHLHDNLVIDLSPPIHMCGVLVTMLQEQAFLVLVSGVKTKVVGKEDHL